MNDTTVVGVGRDEDVRAYVAAVRAWLADLPSDEVDDLTAGMEADLAERAEESHERLGALLGEPGAYAAELRSAAGLPPRAVVPDAVPAEPWTARLSRRAGDLLVRYPWLRELRPTWWLLRGAALGWALAAVLGTGRVVLLPAVGAAASFWLGLTLRRHEPLRHGASLALAVANVVAAVVLLPMLVSYTSAYAGAGDDAAFVESPYSSQVVANGEPVQNLYAYDAAGNRLDGVRLFDQNGRALFVGLDPLMDGSNPEMPVRPEDGTPDVAADVFPLSWPGHDAWEDPGFGWTPPLTLLPVPGAATATSTPSPSSASSPTGAPSPSPITSPSATP